MFYDGHFRDAVEGGLSELGSHVLGPNAKKGHRGRTEPGRGIAQAPSIFSVGEQNRIARRLCGVFKSFAERKWPCSIYRRQAASSEGRGGPPLTTSWRKT